MPSKDFGQSDQPSLCIWDFNFLCADSGDSYQTLQTPILICAHHFIMFLLLSFGQHFGERSRGRMVEATIYLGLIIARSTHLLGVEQGWVMCGTSKSLLVGGQQVSLFLSPVFDPFYDRLGP